MYLKKLFYKFTNKDKHFFYKNSLKRDNHEKIIKRIYDSEIRNKIENIHNINKKKKELSFSHCGHLGDVINSLPTVKELSKNHKCDFFIHSEKKLENSAKNYKGFGDEVYLKDTIGGGKTSINFCVCQLRHIYHLTLHWSQSTQSQIRVLELKISHTLLLSLSRSHRK